MLQYFSHMFSVYPPRQVDLGNILFQGHYQPIRMIPPLHLHPCIQPSIAQLVERWTVVVLCQISIGRWFKSGSKEFLPFLLQENKNYLNLVLGM